MLMSVLKEIFHKPPEGNAQPPVSGEPHPSVVWLDRLVMRMFQLMHNYEQDNFDADRYRNEPSNVFFSERHAMYFRFLLQNVDNFLAARELLQDEASRQLFDQLVLFRVLGHLHVRLPFNTAANRAKIAAAEACRVEDTNEVGPFGPLAIYLVRGAEGDV